MRYRQAYLRCSPTTRCQQRFSSNLLLRSTTTVYVYSVSHACMFVSCLFCCLLFFSRFFFIFLYLRLSPKRRVMFATLPGGEIPGRGSRPVKNLDPKAGRSPSVLCRYRGIDGEPPTGSFGGDSVFLLNTTIIIIIEDTGRRAVISWGRRWLYMVYGPCSMQHHVSNFVSAHNFWTNNNNSWKLKQW